MSVFTPKELGGQQTRVAFLFGGESHYMNMGLDLYKNNTFFRASMQECDDMLRRHANIDLLTSIYTEEGNDGSSDDDEVGTPTRARPLDARHANASVFAVQYSLARTVQQQWGVTPAAVMGYSVGELSVRAHRSHTICSTNPTPATSQRAPDTPTHPRTAWQGLSAGSAARAPAF